MSIIKELQNLSSRERSRIQSVAAKLRGTLPGTHTIILKKKPGIGTAREITGRSEVLVLIILDRNSVKIFLVLKDTFR